MHWLNVDRVDRCRRCLVRAARATILCAVLVAPVWAAEEGPVIPPGQEELLAAMLGKGATLPSDCKLADAEVDHTFVKATYTCQGGDVVIKLTHPSKAAARATKTERFALEVLSGTPPPGLQGALESLIRSRESAFTWKVLEVPQSNRARRKVVLAAVAGVIGIAAVVAWARRRGRQTHTVG